MSCDARAVLMITKIIEDTATNVARARVDLRCHLATGHEGPHHDETHDERWEGSTTKVTTLLRSEEELDGG